MLKGGGGGEGLSEEEVPDSFDAGAFEIVNRAFTKKSIHARNTYRSMIQ